LVLLTLGVSGAWIGSLTALEPYHPIFIGIALVALLFAWRRAWRPAATCGRDEACATPATRLAYKTLFCIVIVLIVVALGFPVIAPWFY